MSKLFLFSLIISSATYGHIHHYQITIDSTLKRLKVIACFLQSESWKPSDIKIESSRRIRFNRSLNIFMTLYQQHVPSAHFPNLSKLYRQLGIKEIKNSIILNDSAPLSKIRRDITTGRL